MAEQYKKLTQREHVLNKSSMYIGDTSRSNFEEWILNNENKMEKKNVCYSKGLLKIFDEIISNTQDIFNKKESKKFNITTVNVYIEKDIISVTNDGSFIPLEKFENTDKYIASVLFGEFFSSSNYENDSNDQTIGTFGIGAKAANIFSNIFRVRSFDGKKLFSQVWKNNMEIEEEPIISDHKGNNTFVNIVFQPDLARFETKSFDEGIMSMFKKRVIDLAAMCPGLKVFFNKNNFTMNTFKNYLSLYSSEKPIYELSKDYEFAIFTEAKEGDQISFVNGNLTKSGIHINNFLSILTKILKDNLEKKKIEVSSRLSLLLKQNVLIFINCKVTDPKYNGQIKEVLVNGVLPNFELSTKSINAFNKSNLMLNLIKEVKLKEEKNLDKKVNTKTGTFKDRAKLDDAQAAGTRESHKCQLILTEGDSAKTIAVTGLSVLKRKYYGIFPLKGKLLNVREATKKKISENQEIKALMSILGLDINKKYDTVSGLRYGRVMLMTDQDQDGSHIKGLIINFIHYYWPELLKTNFFFEFITPIIKATNKKETIEFYNLQDFNNWYKEKDHTKFNIKYYKGLGTSTPKEALGYFERYDEHTIDFVYNKDDGKEIEKAFAKKNIELRKKWLSDFMKTNRDFISEDAVLYNRSNKERQITYGDFINKELIHFSNADNIRSIPNVIDGLKPGQRKIMHVVFGMSFPSNKPEIKVEQLAGKVSSESAYHHGEQSLKMTIINLANDFIGSNNINLLSPNGQYGSRLQGGKDCSSPRYIFTNLPPIMRKIFIKEDEYVLKYLIEENQSIEPEYFVPIIPMVLVNGARGIGTGWATNIPCFNPLDIINELLGINKPDFIFKPWYKSFTGQTFMIEPSVFILTGNIYVSKKKPEIVITELPIGTWTQNFKSKIIENPNLIMVDHGTKDSVCLQILFPQDVFTELNNKENGFYNFFKLYCKIYTSNLIAFDKEHVLREFSGPKEIIEEHKEIRLSFYSKRKSFLLEKIKKHLIILKNQIRFITAICNDELIINKKKKSVIIEMLKKDKYDLNPDTGDYDYLIKMAIEQLSFEKIEELENKIKNEENKRDELEKTSIEEMWKKELLELKDYYLKNHVEKNIVSKRIQNFDFVNYVLSDKKIKDIPNIIFDDDEE